MTGGERNSSINNLIDWSNYIDDIYPNTGDILGDYYKGNQEASKKS